jgi:cell division protein FtsB
MSAKKIVFFGILIISLFIINNLSHSIYSLWQKRQLVTDAKLEVDKEKQRNLELKNKLNQIKRPQFIEEEARNKLFLSKPGEQILVISEKDLAEATASVKPKPRDTRPNWKKWWDMFF